MATFKVDVQPELFRWARERARLDQAALTRAFPRLPEWERGDSKPTFKQLESYARRTRAPIGYFFLKEPPDEPLPVDDFRTFRDKPIARPSAALLNTLYICLERQDWYRQYLLIEGADRLPFVGSLKVGSNVQKAAASMREALEFDVETRTGFAFAEALRAFRRNSEALGVLVMSSGIVGNATQYRLDPEEFRGFALVDDYAPVVFVNAADSTGAQIFTLAHELVHVWTGRSGVTDDGLKLQKRTDDERWCNSVAAELLVPVSVLRKWFKESSDSGEEIQRLALKFKVSSLVVLRRLVDAEFITEARFRKVYRDEIARIQKLARKKPKGDGGNFYNSELARVNRRFAQAIVASTLEGNTTYTEACRLLSVKNVRTLMEVGRQVGVIV